MQVCHSGNGKLSEECIHCVDGWLYCQPTCRAVAEKTMKKFRGPLFLPHPVDGVITC